MAEQCERPVEVRQQSVGQQLHDRMQIRIRFLQESRIPAGKLDGHWIDPRFHEFRPIPVDTGSPAGVWQTEEPDAAIGSWRPGEPRGDTNVVRSHCGQDTTPLREAADRLPFRSAY